MRGVFIEIWLRLVGLVETGSTRKVPGCLVEIRISTRVDWLTEKIILPLISKTKLQQKAKKRRLLW